jgi:transposase
VGQHDRSGRPHRENEGRPHAHLKYKAESAIDLDSEIIVSAEVYHGGDADTQTIEDTVMMGQMHLSGAGTDCQIKETVADKGYHSEESLDRLQNESQLRTYIPEPQRKQRRTWHDKPLRRQAAYQRNRRNTRGARGRRLQRLRSERAERSFAHLCDTGGARRTWLRGLEKVRKRFLSVAMAYNLGRILRSLLGAGKPRYLAVLAEKLCFIYMLMRWRDALLTRMKPPRRALGNITRRLELFAA